MKAILDTLDDVAEPLRGEYESHEGRYRLKVEGTPAGFVPSSEHVDVRTKLSEFRRRKRENRAVKPLVYCLYQLHESVQPRRVAEDMTRINTPCLKSVVREDLPLTQVTEVYELANNSMGKPRIGDPVSP